MPRRPRTTGRPPAVADPQRVARMIEAITAGVPIGQACQHAGISESAHRRAMAAGEAAQDALDARQAARDAGQDPDQTAPAPDGRADAYRAYRSEVLRARAAVAVVHVALVGKAARGGALVSESTTRNPDGSVTTSREYARPEWKASQFLLATSFRDDFGPPTRRQVEHTGADGGPIEHTGPADAALSTIAERLAQVASAQRAQLPGGWDRGGGPPAVLGPGSDVVDAELVEPGQDGAS